MSTPEDLSRRDFGKGAGMAGLTLLGRPWRHLMNFVLPDSAHAAIPAVSSATSSAVPEIFTVGFPRAFVYRQCSLLAATLDYPTWSEQMSPLNGIIGKVLLEEEPASANALDYFVRFKQQFPSKLVLEHLNGWERVPQWETTNWFAGFWLHRLGTKLSWQCASTDTVLHVGTTTCFSLSAGLNRDRGDDICIAAIGTSGLPDFTRAEQVSLTGINPTQGTITVQRAQYGTAPLQFARGSFIAPHVTHGPFVGNGPMVWMYNFSTAAPKDPNGKTVIDAIVDGLAPGEGLAAKFAPGGALATFDGLKLDAFSWLAPVLAKVDCNNDGIADDGYFGGVNTFGIGADRFVQALRNALGPTKIIIIDAQNVTTQHPDSALMSGLELEGFPNLFDLTAVQWSEALATLGYYRTAFVDNPHLIYPNYKTDFFPPFTGQYPFRLALAASLVAGTPFTFYQDPDGATPIKGKLTNLTIWDEILGGSLQTPNWLGQPLGPPVRPTMQHDVLGGSGVVMNSSFTSKFRGSNMKFSVAAPGAAGTPMTVSKSSGAPSPLTFEVLGVPLTGSDLILQLDVSSTPVAGPYSPTLVRRLFVTAQRSGGTFKNTQSTPAAGNWFTVILYFRSLQGSGSTANLVFEIEGAHSLELRNITAYNGPEVVFRQFQHGAVFVNPSAAPYTFSVSSLAPSTSFKRLTATNHAGSDPITNNGQPIGSTVTIPRTDALIVMNGP